MQRDEHMRPGEVGHVRRAIARRCRRICTASVDRQGGFGLVEVIAGFSIMFVGFFALAAATGSASRMVVRGGQRQAATQVANARLEDLRNLAYTGVALSAPLVHSSDTTSPDFYVSVDGASYDALHNGILEELVVDAAIGQVPHLMQDITVGTTTMDAYQYVTWVDDPTVVGTRDYRRMSIVVRYLDGNGRARTVQAAALLTPGSITIGGSTAAPTTGSATPTPTAEPTATPTGSCSGDTAAPTGGFSILSGTGAQTGYTASTTATLSLAPSDPCSPISYRVSNDGSAYSGWSTFDATAPNPSWTLTNGDGLKSVWVQFEDAVGNRATAGPATVTLDMTPPTVPGTLTRTANCSGASRTVTLNWGVSSDTNWLGYRVHKSVNGGAFEALGSVATTSMSDTHDKGLTSVSFRTVAYDKAGNEGNPTDVITLSKNQCS